jgi:hypothetical protein
MPIRGVLPKVLIVNLDQCTGKSGGKRLVAASSKFDLRDVSTPRRDKYARLFAQPDMVLTVFIEPIIYWLDGPFPEHAGFPWFPACRL